MGRIKKYINAVRLGIAIKKIRNHMKELGFPVDHLTDEQLVERVMAFGRMAAKAGVTAEEATTAMRNLDYSG